MTTRYSRYLPAFTYISDLVLLNVALGIAYTTGQQFSGFLHDYFSVYALISNLVWLLVSQLSGSHILRRPLVLRDHVNKILLTLTYHLVLVLGILYFLRRFQVPVSILSVSISLFFLFIVMHRSIIFFVLDYIRKKGFNLKHVVILGDKDIAERLVKSFEQHPEYGYNFIKFISKDELEQSTLTQVTDLIKANKAEEVFICYKEVDSGFVRELMKECAEDFIQVKLVSDLFLENSHAHLVNYNGIPALAITPEGPAEVKMKVLKRAFDLAFSSIVMFSGLPVFVLLVIITKFTSRGPVFYKQQRIGLQGKPFYIYKFRSMYIDAEKFGPQLSSGDNDPRITKWGRIMRKTRLDELPQFWNVFKGDMSVVGPRPERQYFIEQIIERSPDYKKLLRIKPGITSLGQVQYGYAENVEQMCHRMRYDLAYLRKVNLNSDINIILQTVMVMIQAKGK
ncbi:sugar transferase [Arcticibacter sp. MXS-1]|uniref:sugar transferase n=1 Tax=Arcticibacter sp. MXS-1 TaxID=3341726 RepID=UPI0035A8C920